MNLVMGLGHFEPRLDYLDVALRRLASPLRLLLKGVKDINHLRKAHGVNSSISIAIFIIDHFQNATSAKPFQGLGTRMLLAVLCIVDRKTHDATNLVGKGAQVVPGRSDPMGRLLHLRKLLYSDTAIIMSTN
jgi:hypothetical protein